MGVACETDGSSIQSFGGKPEGMGPLVRARHNEENKTDILTEIVWNSVDWIDLAHDGENWRAVMNTLLNIRVQ
jgi:hypothetical protein